MDDITGALNEMTRFYVRTLGDRRELSMAAGSCLTQLQQHGPMRLTSLAAAEGAGQPSMSQLVQRLEKQGLVVRIADPEDGRASLVALSRAGEEALAQRRRERDERLEQLLAGLPEESVAALRLAMQVSVPLIRRLTELAAESERVRGGA